MDRHTRTLRCWEFAPTWRLSGGISKRFWFKTGLRNSVSFHPSFSLVCSSYQSLFARGRVFEILFDAYTNLVINVWYRDNCLIRKLALTTKRSLSAAESIFSSVLVRRVVFWSRNNSCCVKTAFRPWHACHNMERVRNSVVNPCNTFLFVYLYDTALNMTLIGSDTE